MSFIKIMICISLWGWYAIILADLLNLNPDNYLRLLVIMPCYIVMIIAVWINEQQNIKDILS